MIIAVLLSPLAWSTSPIWLVVLSCCGLLLLSDRVSDWVRGHRAIALALVTLTTWASYSLVMLVCACEGIFLGWFVWW